MSSCPFLLPPGGEGKSGGGHASVLYSGRQSMANVSHRYEEAAFLKEALLARSLPAGTCDAAAAMVYAARTKRKSGLRSAIIIHLRHLQSFF